MWHQGWTIVIEVKLIGMLWCFLFGNLWAVFSCLLYFGDHEYRGKFWNILRRAKRGSLSCIALFLLIATYSASLPCCNLSCCPVWVFCCTFMSQENYSLVYRPLFLMVPSIFKAIYVLYKCRCWPNLQADPLLIGDKVLRNQPDYFLSWSLS